MDIGIKMKNARLSAQLTQEQAAEELDVSRQTISNWETGKTYPDIVSVVKMSDLYHISLELLLKEEKPMSGYLDYLQESTNVVKSKKNFITFWFFTTGSDAMGYSLMFLWILLPVTTFVLSLLIGRNDYWGKWNWISAILFGIMYMLAEYGTFNIGNMIAFHKINLPRFEMILTGALISLVGLGIGTIIYKSKEKRYKEITSHLPGRTKSLQRQTHRCRAAGLTV